jgi:hypothetical protein
LEIIAEKVLYAVQQKFIPAEKLEICKKFLSGDVS